MHFDTFRELCAYRGIDTRHIIILGLQLTNLKIRHESETTIRRRSNHYASNGIKSLYREGGYCGVAWNGDGDR